MTYSRYVDNLCYCMTLGSILFSWAALLIVVRVSLLCITSDPSFHHILFIYRPLQCTHTRHLRGACSARRTHTHTRESSLIFLFFLLLVLFYCDVIIDNYRVIMCKNTTVLCAWWFTVACRNKYSNHLPTIYTIIYHYYSPIFLLFLPSTLL